MSSRQRPVAERAPFHRGRRLMVLSLFVAALAGDAATSAAQGFDPLELYRMLKARKLATRDYSKPINLRDAASGRSVSMRFARRGEGEYAVFVSFGRGRKLHPHTFLLETDQAGTLVLAPRPAHSADERDELLAAQVSPEDLRQLSESTRVAVLIRGWGETFRAELNDKQLSRIQRFADSH